MAEKPVYLTAEGLAKLETELEYLRHTRRPQVADRISQTTHSGGSADDSEFDDAKNEQAFVEGRINTLEHLIRNAQIIRHESDSGVVQMGSKVTAISSDGDEMTYVIVGSAEAQPRQGRISNESPVGRALLGRRVGDEVQVLVPAGLLKLKITTIA